MKIKILKEIPVQTQFRPTVGKVYDVIFCVRLPAGDLALIDVDGTKVGVFTAPARGECEVIENE